MRVIRKRLGEPAEVIQIQNTLKALQDEVGGYIEVVTFASDAAIICDEEGKIKGKPFNCNLLGTDFVGTILVVGIDQEQFCDIPQAAVRIFPQKEKAPAGRPSKQGAREINQVQDTLKTGLCQGGTDYVV